MAWNIFYNMCAVGGGLFVIGIAVLALVALAAIMAGVARSKR